MTASQPFQKGVRMFASKHLRRFISHMPRDQRYAIQAGVVALLLLPMLFINAFM